MYIICTIDKHLVVIRIMVGFKLEARPINCRYHQRLSHVKRTLDFGLANENQETTT